MKAAQLGCLRYFTLKCVAGKGVELMVSKYLRLAAAATVILLALCCSASAQNTPGMSPIPPQALKTQPFVSPIFADNMVLQRGKANTIWGWSEPGDHVQVQIEIGRASCRERAEISRVAG